MNDKLLAFIKRYWILLIIVTIKLVLQFAIVNPAYELHRDEFLHLDQGNHLAFGFISVPPLSSLLSGIILFFGGSIFWVRFFPAIFGALTIIFVWLIVESLEGGIFSKILASCALLFSILFRLNILFQPNSFDILAWTLIFYLLIKYLKNEHPKWLFFLALVIAIGFYNKYNIAFILAGLFIGILTTYHRRLFVNKDFWKAVLVAVILILPNLIWQYQHDFPVIHHMKVLKERQLDNNTSLFFLKGQLLFFIGSLPLTIGGIIALLTYKPFRAYRFIGIAILVTLSLFTILKAKDYYAVGLYPVLFAIGSVYFEKIISQKWKLVVFPVLIINNLLVFIVTLKIIYPLLTPVEIRQNPEPFEKIGMLRWEDGENHMLPQDFADMIGWEEMAEKSLAAYQQIPKNELENTLIFCDNYGETGALNYYNRGKMPSAYSFNTDYIFWLPRIEKIQNVLLVGDKPEQELINMFAVYKKIGAVENEYAREKNTGIYLLLNAEPGFTKLFYDEADRRIKDFKIF